ncbi:hypothetical protein OIV83_002966 [Microbotryomycetes sp. JL201]|nr:hypothetical protein OIV83_002966 [Microbotryomycetes sp. JL201]
MSRSQESGGRTDGVGGALRQGSMDTNAPHLLMEFARAGVHSPAMTTTTAIGPAAPFSGPDSTVESPQTYLDPYEQPGDIRTRISSVGAGNDVAQRKRRRTTADTATVGSNTVQDSAQRQYDVAGGRMSAPTSRTATPDSHIAAATGAQSLSTSRVQFKQGPNGQLVSNHSCEECKRRKVKCDRQVPCGACIRRNRADVCRTESERPKIQHKKVYALESDFKRLARRLAEVEKVLKIKPAPASPQQPESQTSTPHGASYYSADEFEDAEIASDEGVALEQAATRLEVAAYNSRPKEGGNYRASDSLPFFDNTIEYREVKNRVRRPSGTPPIDPEYTSAMTSILAPTTDVLWSAAAEMGIDPFLTGTEIVQARKEALERVFRVLPTKEDSFSTIKMYFDELDWVIQATTKTAFLPEHERFWQMYEQGRGSEVDCLWLAVYFMLLAIARSSLRTTRSTSNFPFASCPPPTTCYAAARRLLHLGDWSARPRARTIQAVLLMSSWVQTSSLGGEAARVFNWIAGAVRVAHGLGLHRLGTDPEVMPPDDSAWPPGKNARKRQSAIRLFSSLRLLENVSSQRFRANLIDATSTTTGFVSNVEFETLSMTDWHFEEQPLSVSTDGTFEHVKSRLSVLASASGALMSNGSHVPYERVLEIDAQFNEILDDLPDDWKLPLPKGAKKGSAEMRWKRHAVQEVIHNRLVRLHRPYFARGLQEHSPYRKSREQCVKSARIVIQSHHDIMDVTNIVWFSYSHALTAALVLFADLFHAIDSGKSTQELDEMSEYLVMAYTIFSRSDEIASSILRSVAQQGAKVISGLFMAEKKRRHLREAGAKQTAEPFAKILQQITKELDTPPPRQNVPLSGAQAGSSALGLNTDLGGNSNLAQQIYASSEAVPALAPFWANPAYVNIPATAIAPASNYDGMSAGALPVQTNMGGPAGAVPLDSALMSDIDGALLQPIDWSWLDASGGAGMLGSGGPGLDGSNAPLPGSQFDSLLSGW